MLDEGNEDSLSARDVVVVEKMEKGIDGFEVSGLSELVNEGGVRGVGVSVAHLVVLVEEGEGFIWVLDFLEIFQEWDGFFSGSVMCVFVVGV